MALGIMETVIPIALIALAVVLFGRKAIKKLLDDFFGVKKDYEELKKKHKN